jgi:uncharacterized membrane protein YecN with MAPEG domain
MRPDIADPTQHAAYRAELRSLARGWRLAGFALILLGVAGLFYLRAQESGSSALRTASWTMITAGWLIFLAVIVYRTRYHKARMAEDPAAP